MRLSTRSRYAVMAMTEMAGRHGQDGLGPGSPAGRPVSIAEIAQAQMLSAAYLEQLFSRLRRAGLVASARGPGGGYRLARPPGDIAIGEIVEAVEEPIDPTRCEEATGGCLAGNRCLTHDLWAELGSQIRLFLLGITLADVVEERVAGRAVPPRADILPPAAE